MNKLVIKRLLIFEPATKRGKKICFNKGVNVISSSQKDGNKVGKSVIMKSIYHTLGADCFFDDMWTETQKLYYIDFSVNSVNYSVYRNQRLFKLYEESKLVLATVDRGELSEVLSRIYDFKVLLPNRNENELVLTPPSFIYLLNYTDQDYMSGSKFASFDKLGQFEGFKENTIYNHFGIFNEEYFMATRVIEELKREEQKLNKERELLENMLVKINDYLKGNDAPTNIETLEVELKKIDEEYSEVICSLNKIKSKLTTLRNEKIELHEAIFTLQKESNIELKTIKTLKTDTCPICKNEIESSNLIINKSNHFEDLIIIKQELEAAFIEVDLHLKKKQNEYEQLLSRRNTFEQQISPNKKNISSVLSHMGYTKTKENLLFELGTINLKFKENNEKLNENKKLLKEYNDIKIEANNKYYQYLLKAKEFFGLEEIDDRKFESIRLNFTAGGSNKPLATIMWHISLLNVKFSYNKNSIRFPIVFDSPNNVEADDTKKHDLLYYIFNHYDKDSQLIVSTLGFDENEFKDFRIDQIIKLTNNKYELLNEKDYNENSDVLKMVYDDNLLLEN